MINNPHGSCISAKHLYLTSPILSSKKDSSTIKVPNVEFIKYDLLKKDTTLLLEVV